MELTINKADKEDVRDIVKMIKIYDRYEHSKDKTFPITKDNEIKETFLSDLRTNRAFYYLAKINDKCVGIIIWSIYQSGKVKWGVLQDLIIIEGQRGKGIGTKLQDFCIKEMKILGCKSVKSFVLFNNKKGIEFWKKKGFKSEVIKGYKISRMLK